eukprot:gnl/MRDRNA2_/MRDRNA2_105270_c0_seq1.p1 gnl/MRDRNA2_/MRDRNA2_105270_c0~~gnl/MRDRNA2_/MRDRNA2_105270_c0_seq1.p1  ORF type:complete len:470 (+),score=53.24 gnl/MRDRNA2_/MRDRNA2_105270_c0_seq1:139-1548(+)
MQNAASERTPLRGRSSSCGDIAFRARCLTIVFSIAEGYDLGVMANALEPLKEEFRLNSLMVGVVVSSFLWIGVIVSPLTGSLLDSMGRKFCICIAAALTAAGNLCWAFAPNVWVIIIGRIIMGSGLGIGIPAVTTYMAEVAPVNQRGMYVAVEEVCLSAGILLGFLSGALIVGLENDWRIMVGIGAVLPTMCAIVAPTSYLVESPRFLQGIGRVEEARQVLLELLGDEEEVDKAFAKWAEEAQIRQHGLGWSSALSAFCGSHFRASLAAIGLGFWFMAIGPSIVGNYSASVLVASGMSRKHAAYVVVLVGVTKLVFTFLPFFLMDRWGRRPLLLTSVIICGCGHAIVTYAIFNYMGGIWIALGFCVFVVGFSSGIGPVFYVYTGEVFDNSIRAKGVGVSFFVYRLTASIWVFLFPVLSAAAGYEVSYLLLAGFCALAFIYIWCFCLETLGVPLESINDIFQGQKHASKI